MIVLPKPLILGSKSPRRSDLLNQMNLSFEVFTCEVDESFPNNTPLHKIAEYIAQKKSSEIFKQVDQNCILLTADSVVACDNQLYEKPKDFDDAFRILTNLSGKQHVVYTGVSIVSLEKEIHFTEATYVTLDPMSSIEIEYYINKDQPFDKAGSYGIQDWIGVCKVSKISGSYTNIMGLPTHAVYQNLQNFL